MRTKRKNNIKRKIKDALDYPAEIILNAPRVVLDSNINVWIENHKGIVEYSDILVRVNTMEFTIKVSGTQLAVDFITSEDVSISGNIVSVEYD